MTGDKPYSTLDEFFTKQDPLMLSWFEQNRAIFVRLIRERVQNSENWTDDDIVREFVQHIRGLEAEQRRIQDAEARRAEAETRRADLERQVGGQEIQVSITGVSSFSSITEGTPSHARGPVRANLDLGDNAPGHEGSVRLMEEDMGTFVASDALSNPDDPEALGRAGQEASSDGISSVQNFEPLPVAFGAPPDHVEEEDNSLVRVVGEQQELNRKTSAKYRSNHYIRGSFFYMEARAPCLLTVSRCDRAGLLTEIDSLL
jgi:hypothetical protein